MVGQEIEPAVFQLCGETPKDLSEARDMINSMILREHVTIPIRYPAIAHFTKEDGEMLNVIRGSSQSVSGLIRKAKTLSSHWRV